MTDTDTSTNESTLSDVNTDAIASTITTGRELYDRGVEPFLAMLDAYFPYGSRLARITADQVFYMAFILPTLSLYLIASGVIAGPQALINSLSESIPVFAGYATEAMSSPVIVAAGAAIAYTLLVYTTPETEAAFLKDEDSVTTWRTIPAAVKASTFGVGYAVLATSGVFGLLPVALPEVFVTESAGIAAAVATGGVSAGILRRVIEEDAQYTPFSAPERVYNIASRTPVVAAFVLLALGSPVPPIVTAIMALTPVAVSGVYYSWRSSVNADYEEVADEVSETAPIPTRDIDVHVSRDEEKVELDFHTRLTYNKDVYHHRAALETFTQDAIRVYDSVDNFYSDRIPQSKVDTLTQMLHGAAKVQQKKGWIDDEDVDDDSDDGINVTVTRRDE